MEWDPSNSRQRWRYDFSSVVMSAKTVGKMSFAKSPRNAQKHSILSLKIRKMTKQILFDI